MKTRLINALCLMVPFACLVAQEAPRQYDVRDARRALETWTSPDWDEPPSYQLPPLKLGKTGWVAEGPLIDTFRPRPRPETERTPVQKFFDLPIVSIFAPTPWPRPSREGSYFAWGAREQSWATVAEQATHGPVGVLLSVRR